VVGASIGYGGKGEEATIFTTVGSDDDPREGNHEGEGLLSLVMAV